MESSSLSPVNSGQHNNSQDIVFNMDFRNDEKHKDSIIYKRLTLWFIQFAFLCFLKQKSDLSITLRTSLLRVYWREVNVFTSYLLKVFLSIVAGS